MKHTQNIMASEPEDLSFSDIVWQQFKKNRLALGSLWLLGLLFALAVGAPLLASERPFIWSDASGLYFPWFASLFDHNYYENGIDKFFNLLLVLGTPLLGTWLLLQRKIGASNMEKRLRRSPPASFRSLVRRTDWSGVYFDHSHPKWTTKSSQLRRLSGEANERRTHHSNLSPDHL